MMEIIYAAPEPEPPHFCNLPKIDPSDPILFEGSVIKCEICERIYVLRKYWHKEFGWDWIFDRKSKRKLSKVIGKKL